MILLGHMNGFFDTIKYLGLHAYAINREGAAMLLREVNADCIKPIDVFTGDMIKQGKPIGWSPTPVGGRTPYLRFYGIFYQDQSEGSTIAWGRSLKSKNPIQIVGGAIRRVQTMFD
jgi:hypothetical protein